MDETRRRRRPSFALGAIVALLAAGNCVAFVAQPYTGATGNKNAKLAAGSTRISRSVAPVDHRKQHRQQQRSVATAASARRRISRTSLAGAVDPNAEVDHFDGWNPTPGTNIGTVSLVGSGPGDPDLLTVSGLRELQSADLVIADRLVSKEILGLVKGELRVARKYPGCAEQAQREIYRWMREGLSEGKHVVRLKIGDPFIFGRGAEEVLEMRHLGVEAKVVPGISSVFSAPLLGGVPVTHRGVATQVTLGTGYGQDYARPDICDYHPQKTAVFLMAIGRLEELCEDLVRRNYPTDCPVAIIENASTPRQRLIAGEVQNIVEIARGLNVKAPATIVVGEVVTVLHGREHGLLSDASEGMFKGVDAEKIERAARKVAEQARADFGVSNFSEASAEAGTPSPSFLSGQFSS